MHRRLGFVIVLAAALAPAPVVSGQQAGTLAGVWSLNPSLSEMPREIGFDVSWMAAAAGADRDARAGGGGRGRGSRSSGAGSRGPENGPFSRPLESYEEAQRRDLLTTEARKPPTRLTIVDTASAVTFTNELGQTRTIRPTGRDEAVEIEGLAVVTTAKREGDRLTIDYRVSPDRSVSYTYTPRTSPAQLVVDVQLVDHGKAGDHARRVYDQGTTPTTGGPASSAAQPAPQPPTAPAAQAQETFDERPGAELRGLKAVGILVEELGANAKACGLSHDAIEAALSKKLADGGLAVRRNSDEDTYVYVNVITNTIAGGTCVSRYDAFLYTHATANLSYHERPALVQVSLMHRGGMGASAPAAHAAAVTQALEGYADLFVGQIRAANR